MKNDKKIRVAIVDDHALFREGLKDLLLNQGDFDVVAQGGDGMSALRIAKEYNPDVMILDLCMPHLGGISAIRRLRVWHSNLKIIVITMYEDDDHRKEAAQAGADGYHSKMDDASEVMKTVREVCRRRRSAPPRPSGDRDGEGSLEAVQSLTSVEQRVLEELGRGLPNRQLSEKLAMSQQTVKNHLNSIFRKMGVKSRLEAVRKGIEKKWITVYQ